MSIIPNFEAHGYKFLETLNNNSQAGRITYKAIKFQLKRLSSLSNFDLLHREIGKLISRLNEKLMSYKD